MVTAKTYLLLISDAYKRMSTTRDKQYREDQQAKVDRWLEVLTKMFEEGEFVPGVDD